MSDQRQPPDQPDPPDDEPTAVTDAAPPPPPDLGEPGPDASGPDAGEGSPPPPPDLSEPGPDASGPDAGEGSPLHITELTPPPPPPPLGDDEPALGAADEPSADGDRPTPPESPETVGPSVASVPTGPGPDPVSGPPDRPGGRWPPAAKAAVAILAVLALAGIVGTIVGFARASSAEDDASASSQEVADALQRAQDAERELAAAQAESAEQLEQLAGERDAAIARAEESEAATELLDQALAERETENEQLAADLAASEEALVELEGLVGDIEGLFPVSIEQDLAALDVAGPYSISLTEVSCVGLDLCGSPPQLGASTLSAEGGGLRLVVPDRLDIPLVAVGGSLFGVADEQALVPPCGDIPRDPALTMGLFGDSASLDADGDLTVSSLAGSVLIDVQAVGDCPVGRVWYRAQLDSAG